MNHRLLLSVLGSVSALSLVAGLSREAAAQSIKLFPTFDAYSDSQAVYDLPYLRTGNTESERFFNEDPPGRMEFRSVLTFDVSAIPSNATLTLVKFGIVQQAMPYSGQNGINQFVGLNQAWDPANAQQMHDAVTIEAQGGTAMILDGNFTCTFCQPGPETTPNAAQLHELSSDAPGAGNIRGFIQGWVDGSRQNFGLGVKQGQEGFGRTGRQFVSSDVINPRVGDVNLDGVTDGLDLSAWAEALGTRSVVSAMPPVDVPLLPADLDYDTRVEGVDFLIWQRDYGTVAGEGPGPSSPYLYIEYTVPGAAAVPEPTTWLAWAALAPAVHGLRRRRAAI